MTRLHPDELPDPVADLNARIEEDLRAGLREMVERNPKETPMSDRKWPATEIGTAWLTYDPDDGWSEHDNPADAEREFGAIVDHLRARLEADCAGGSDV